MNLAGARLKANKGKHSFIHWVGKVQKVDGAWGRLDACLEKRYTTC